MTVVGCHGNLAARQGNLKGSTAVCLLLARTVDDTRFLNSRDSRGCRYSISWHQYWLRLNYYCLIINRSSRHAVRGANAGWPQAHRSRQCDGCDTRAHAFNPRTLPNSRWHILRSSSSIQNREMPYLNSRIVYLSYEAVYEMRLPIPRAEFPDNNTIPTMLVHYHSEPILNKLSQEIQLIVFDHSTSQHLPRAQEFNAYLHSRTQDGTITWILHKSCEP